MASIILNSFFRALTSIDENEGIKNLTVKQLTQMLVDTLYPEDGVLTWEDTPLGKEYRVRFSEKLMNKVDRIEVDHMPAEATVTIPVADPEPAQVNRADTGGAAPRDEPPKPLDLEIKEVKVKETKPKLTKEQKEAEKAAKAKAKADAEAAKAKAKADAEAAKVKAKADAEAEKVAKPEPEVKVEKPKVTKAKFVGNMEKLNPTQDKLLKKVATDMKVELAADAKVKFLAFANALDNKDFVAKKLEEHMKDFFAPKEPKIGEEECLPVEYEGKSYWVAANGTVYETEVQADGTEIDKKVGTVGMAKFANMKQPVDA